MNVDHSGGYSLVAWITLALINAGLAESKGRGRLQWFLVSLILGPIATLLVVTWPRATKPLPDGLHPLRSAGDRYLLGATVALGVVVIAAVIAVTGGVSGQDAVGVGIAIVVAVLGALGFTVAIRGYNRRSPQQSA